MNARSSSALALAVADFWNERTGRLLIKRMVRSLSWFGKVTLLELLELIRKLKINNFSCHWSELNRKFARTNPKNYLFELLPEIIQPDREGLKQYGYLRQNMEKRRLSRKMRLPKSRLRPRAFAGLFDFLENRTTKLWHTVCEHRLAVKLLKAFGANRFWKSKLRTLSNWPFGRSATFSSLEISDQ